MDRSDRTRWSGFLSACLKFGYSLLHISAYYLERLSYNKCSLKANYIDQFDHHHNASVAYE